MQKLANAPLSINETRDLDTHRLRMEHDRAADGAVARKIKRVGSAALICAAFRLLVCERK